jgi:thiamine biosynthesis lipoprotein
MCIVNVTRPIGFESNRFERTRAREISSIREQRAVTSSPLIGGDESPGRPSRQSGSLPVVLVIRWWCLPMLVGLSVIALGCRPAAQTVSIPSVQLLAGRTMGTTYSIKLLPKTGAPLASLGGAVDDELSRVNRQMSTYIEDSELSRFNQSKSKDWFDVSSEVVEVVRLAESLSEATSGAFDVTVGPLTNRWGFGPNGLPEKVPSQEEIDETLKSVGYAKMESREEPPGLRKADVGLQVDLSAIAKGHGVDRVARVLEENGIQDYFVEIGGEVRARGNRQGGGAWRVGIEKPISGIREVIGVVQLKNQSMATSGNYRNFYEQDGVLYSHTIDPRTGRPAERSIVSATVIANDCASADGIATGMMCLGMEEGIQLAEKQGWAVCLMSELDGELAFQVSSEFERLQPAFVDNLSTQLIR